jgi:hypothetical protein
MLILNFFLLKGGMLFCYDLAMYQSKDGKPLNRLMASRGRSFKQTTLALIHEVGAVLCPIGSLCFGLPFPLCVGTGVCLEWVFVLFCFVLFCFLLCYS